MTGQRRALLILDLHPNAASGAGSVIQFQCLTLKPQCLGDQFAAIVRSMDRNKTVGPQREAFEKAGLLSRIPLHVQRYLVSAGRHDAQRGEICSRSPMGYPDPGTYEALAKHKVITRSAGP